MKRRFDAGRLAAIAVLALAIALPSGCGSDASSSPESAASAGAGFPGVDQANTRQVENSSIDTSNVSGLQEAWSVPLTAQSTYGAHAATPVISKGVVYSQDLESNVEAIDLESGKVIWSKKYESPTPGPNGVVADDGTVFGATASAAFALDQKTGKELWSTNLARSDKERVDMAPGYHDGVVYLSTVPGEARVFHRGEGAGILWALDGRTGKRIWHFSTIPNHLWSSKYETVNSGGGLWQPPSFDEEGSVYFGTASPSPHAGTTRFPWGSSRPGPNLYTNSMVKLDAKTGKMRWYYQQTPHDLFDWDFQNPPILVEAGDRELAIGSGKAGFVTAVDRQSGKPVWSTPVGVHNDHADDGLYAMRGEFTKLQPNMAVAPGLMGGVIAPAASDGTTVFVPAVNGVMSVKEGAGLSERSERTGQLIALDAATGEVKWEAGIPSAAYGAPVVANDLVFVTSDDGVVYAFDVEKGREVWQASLPARANAGAMVSGDTLVVPAGNPSEKGQAAAIVAFRLGG